MKKNSQITAGIIAGIVFLLVYNISSFAYQCNEIRSDTIRLHIIANSDDSSDQELKLKVRDAVLEAGKNIFDGTICTENAIDKITPELSELEKVANEVIKANKKSYTATAELTTEYFETRIYDDNITLPAGKYLALRIVIGEGKGQNWWCVMFPSLCLPAVEKTDTDAMKNVYTNTEKDIVMQSDKYVVRLKIIEYIEKIKNKVDNNIFG